MVLRTSRMWRSRVQKDRSRRSRQTARQRPKTLSHILCQSQIQQKWQYILKIKEYRLTNKNSWQIYWRKNARNDLNFSSLYCNESSSFFYLRSPKLSSTKLCTRVPHKFNGYAMFPTFLLQSRSNVVPNSTYKKASCWESPTELGYLSLLIGTSYLLAHWGFCDAGGVRLSTLPLVLVNKLLIDVCMTCKTSSGYNELGSVRLNFNIITTS